MIDSLIIETFPDERFSPLEVSGDVDCFICTSRVNVMRAWKLECNAGPTGFAHESCIQQYEGKTPELWALYNRVVINAVYNLHPVESLKPIR